jgi:microsomal dipeptidase-like Zn-dependent dipeptidase
MRLRFAAKIMSGIGTDVPFLHVGEEELAELKRRTDERRAAGIAAPGEDRPAYIPDLNTERKLELVTDALLKRGYKSAAVEKILGGNFKRVLADILVGTVTQALSVPTRDCGGEISFRKVDN